MLRITPKVLRISRTRCASTHALVFLEHNGSSIEPSSLSAIAAATELGSNITGVIVGSKEDIGNVLPKAKKLKGLTKVLHSSSNVYSPVLPETVSPLLKSLLESSTYTHFLSAHSSAAKSILPRVSATLDLPTISDITSISYSESDGSTTCTRPIYAGNAIATIKASKEIKTKVITVRPTSFNPNTEASSSEVPSEEISAIEDGVAVSLTEHLRTSVQSNTSRPDLGIATKVVSGGRALKSKELFNKTLEPLADALGGAALGASRAAVDAGYADNSLQVGQTGKIVAPELYIAIGISGAIQHLAGMKDSKMIIAINKDADAPIFQVADVGIVGDLFDIVPKLVEELKK